MCLSEPVIFFFFFPSIFIIALDFLFLSAVSTRKVLFKVIFNKCPKLEPSVALKGLLSSALSALSLFLCLFLFPSPPKPFYLGGEAKLSKV